MVAAPPFVVGLLLFFAGLLAGPEIAVDSTGLGAVDSAVPDAVPLLGVSAAGPVDLSSGPWQPVPSGSVFPFFMGYGNVIAAQEGHVAIVSYNRLWSPTVSIALREPDGSWQGPVALGRSYDDHAYPAVAIDAAGHLHVVFGGHARPDFPIVYVQSVRPYDVTEWTAPVTLETERASAYNNLVVAPDGRLLLTYRQGNADHGDIVLRSKAPGQPWSAPQVVVGTDYDAAYPYDLLAEPDGTLHLGFMWRHNQDGAWGDPSYLRSPDGGATWQLADGTPVASPASRDQTSVLDIEVTHNPMLRLTRDADGRMSLFYSQADPTGSLFKVTHLAYGDDVGWAPRPGFATSSFPVGFHLHGDALRVVATTPGDGTQVAEFLLQAGAEAWVVQPLDPVPVRSQLASATGRNVAYPPEGLPWTVAVATPATATPPMRVAQV